MTDWKALARARGLQLSGKELDAMVQPLEALERVFRPLASDLSPDVEPATVYRAGDSE